MKDQFKKVFIAIAVLALLSPISAFATEEDAIPYDQESDEQFIMELQENSSFDIDKTLISYDPTPTDIYLDADTENYINPTTGEYFLVETIATRSGSVAKRFSFNIRVSISSSAFKVNSSRLSVYSKGTMYDNYGKRAKPEYGSTYTVALSQGLKKRSASFPINSSQTSTFGSGWKRNNNTYVSIYNDGSYDKYNRILKGSGVVYNK